MTYIRPSPLVVLWTLRRSFARTDRLASQTLLTADRRRRIKMINTALEPATCTSEIFPPMSEYEDLALAERVS